MSELSKEQQILMTMRKTLTAVIRDVTPPPGLQHPLSAQTIELVKGCLTLIATRERELADELGLAQERPHYADERKETTVVPITGLSRKRQQD